MANTFPVERDDSYEEMAATYQVIEIARLNEVLKKHNMSAKRFARITSSTLAFFWIAAG